MRELNHTRARYGLATVRDDARMDGAASAHSRAMAASGSVTHGSWDGRVAAASRHAGSIGEVLGWRSPDSARSEAAWLVQAWLGSPIHRPIVLGASFRRVGIGRTTGTIAGLTSAIYTVDFASAR